MLYPNFSEEKKLWKKGYKALAGIDEAGRGALAGPVIAAAVIARQFPISNFPFSFKINDSKKLTARQREKIFNFFKNYPEVKWGIGRVGEKAIDKINILEATKLAMERAVKNLEKKLMLSGLRSREASRERSPGSLVDFLLIDGNFKINSKISQKSIIKGDEKIFSCALASIFAKVSRDRMMVNYHKKYPCYGFNRHKGYATEKHREIIKKRGFCEIHRKSFNVS